MTTDAPSRARRVRLAAVLVVAVVVVAATIVVIMRKAPSKHGAVVAPRGAIVPDVAFVDARGLVVRASASSHEVLVAPGKVSTPRWSPSGDLLAYRDGKSLWVVRADGTNRRELANLSGASYFEDEYAWSPVGDALAVIGKTGMSVWWFDGPDPQQVLITPTMDRPTLWSFAWSHDGSTLALAGEVRPGPLGAPVRTIWLATGVCTTGRPISCRVPPKFRPVGYRPTKTEYPIGLAGFAFNDRYLLIWPDFIGSSSVLMDGLPLKAVPIGGGPARTIANTLILRSWVLPSPDGAGLLVVLSAGRTVTDTRALAVCAAPDSCRPLGPGDDVQTLDPAWSPDGKQIAFVREAHGSYTPPIGQDATPLDYWGPKYRTRKLWIANADGSDPREIAAAGGGVADPQFAPDGHSIVFKRDAQLWQLDLQMSRVSPLSASIRSTASCNIDTCLPDAQPYEITARWSDYFAVKFPSSNP